MVKILFSDKDDWKMKSEGRYDKNDYNFNYADFDQVKKLSAYDVVIPLYEKDIHVLNNRFSKYAYKYLIASNDVVDFCNDKMRFNEFLIKNGFKNNIPEILPRDAGFPYILKKNFDEWGLNSHIIDSAEKGSTLSHLTTHKDYFKQEYISGADEHTTHFIFTGNKLQYYKTFKFTFPKSSFIKGLESPPFKTAVIVPVETEHAYVFEKLLQTINYNGVGCFDYKIQNGIAKIFELNPRVGGSLPLDLTNFLESYISLCKSNKLKLSYWQKVKNVLIK